MFEKARNEYCDFQLDPKSTRHAINFTLTIHHLKEWIWESYLNNNLLKYKVLSPSKLMNKKSDYYFLINSECPEIKLIKELANNIKHFYSQDRNQDNDIQETTQSKPWEQISCTWGNFKIPFDYSGLIIINKKNQWLSLLDVFTTVYNYWTIQFETTFHDCE